MTKSDSIFFILLIFVAVAAGSCTRSEKSPPQTGAVTAPAAPRTPCPNGKDAIRISGECKGSWNLFLGADGKKKRCDFNWGPRVRCPEKSKSLGYESVCYGTTQKPIDGSGAGPSSAAECAKQFGTTPLDPRFDLVCCPE